MAKSHGTYVHDLEWQKREFPDFSPALDFCALNGMEITRELSEILDQFLKVIARSDVFDEATILASNVKSPTIPTNVMSALGPYLVKCVWWNKEDREAEDAPFDFDDSDAPVSHNKVLPQQDMSDIEDDEQYYMTPGELEEHIADNLDKVRTKKGKKTKAQQPPSESNEAGPGSTDLARVESKLDKILGALGSDTRNNALIMGQLQALDSKYQELVTLVKRLELAMPLIRQTPISSMQTMPVRKPFE